MHWFQKQNMSCLENEKGRSPSEVATWFSLLLRGHHKMLLHQLSSKRCSIAVWGSLGGLDGEVSLRRLALCRLFCYSSSQLLRFHSYFWWIIFVMLVTMAVLQVTTGDGFGMFFTIILSLIVYYMVADGCSNMSMYCLLVYGLISGFEALFGLLTLFSAFPSAAAKRLRLRSAQFCFCSLFEWSAEVVGGRSSTTTLIKSRDNANIVYETQVSVHPFFDGSQGTPGVFN